MLPLRPLVRPFLLAGLLGACGDGSTGPCDAGSIDGVSIEPALHAIEQGQSVDLSASVVDGCGGPVATQVQWESTEPGVLAVSAQGRATGLAVGTAQIVATAAGGAAQQRLPIEVLRTPLVFATPETLSVRMGGVDTVTAMVGDFTGTLMPEVVVTWHSSDESIATIDGDGLVAGEGMGTAILRGTVAGQAHVPDSVVVVVGPAMPAADDAATHLAGVAASLELGTAPSPALRAIQLAGGITAPLAEHAPLDTAAVPCNYHHQSQIFRDASFGVTYVWDAGQGRYVWSDEPGAPDCGLRLTVYAIDDGTGQPALPLTRIGYVEGRDAGSYWGNPRYTALAVTIREVDGTGAETTIASWTSTRSYEVFSRGYSTTTVLNGWMETRPGPRFEFAVSERHSVSDSPGASYNYVTGSRRYERGDALVTVSRAPTTATVQATIGGAEVRIELNSTNGDPWYEQGAIAKMSGFAVLGTVATATGPFGNLAFRNVDGGLLPAAVDAQFEAFWGSLLANFGVSGWPTL